MLDRLAIEKDIEIADPDPNIFQLRKKKGNQDIFFFVNSNRSVTATIKADFPTGNKVPWIWDAETGERKVYSLNGRDLTIELNPLQSMLLVFEPAAYDDEPFTPLLSVGSLRETLSNPWDLQFDHINGNRFERRLSHLRSFGLGADSLLNTFAGTIIYKTDFVSDGAGKWMALGSVNKGITEVLLNGEKVGVNWYGRPLFYIEKMLKNGTNHIQIKYTSILANYCKSLKDNPMAQKWSSKYDYIPIGLEGPVQIFN
jgi:hypothetical protein